jgi:hypothetical protein
MLRWPECNMNTLLNIAKRFSCALMLCQVWVTVGDVAAVAPHVRQSCTSLDARLIGLAPGQYVGKKSNITRGWLTSHCSTALALWTL